MKRCSLYQVWPIMKKYTAFTLIETLIAIVVFWIGILAVLHGLFQTIRNQEYANMQIKSAFLAREWIELMFNLRDANYRKELEWNCIFKNTEISDFKEYDENENPFCSGYFWSWDDNILKIWIWSGEYIQVETGILSDDFDANFSWFQIYFHTWDVLNDSTWFRYDYTWDAGEATRFARYLLITWVVAEDGEIIDTDKLLKIESHVLYKKWYLTWKKVMETFIGNYEF